MQELVIFGMGSLATISVATYIYMGFDVKLLGTFAFGMTIGTIFGWATALGNLLR